ncbi:reverse transcriptase family protein [Sphingomonas albertensis]|uniref:RNA-directed DNA polymerase n=1 Tax=Sphingomonas albertensis TaxID=2762591 RepID=A0ABR7AN29_9SPHN|nr:reverse transcriptase family protein [Sphingomonas albertensis]MBC3941865.1 RNA-directed DNA polymerase [Sphingomonas albertensis]
MPAPAPQRYRSEGRRKGVPPDVLANALASISRIRDTDPRIEPVLTLRHLAFLTDVPYRYLRQVVARSAATGYRTFRLKKRVPGRSRMRTISVPPPSLKEVQRWIVENVIQHVAPHEASYAFHPGSSPYLAAEEHCECSFLLKVDVQDFFHSIGEGSVAAVFEAIGFQKLISFEMARLVTRPIPSSKPAPDPAARWVAIPYYNYPHEGVLPQGAPTSPMLANLVMRHADQRLANLATRMGMRYTRYADDLAFSAPHGSAIALADMRRCRTQVLRILNEYGFSPNLRKTVIRGPGSRRIVLGMLVDGDRPRLAREFKDNLRLHLHYLTAPSHGPAAHAMARKTGVSSMYHHVRGLISWAQCVDPEYAADALALFRTANWPLVQPRWSGASDDD